MVSGLTSIHSFYEQYLTHCLAARPQSEGRNLTFEMPLIFLGFLFPPLSELSLKATQVL